MNDVERRAMMAKLHGYEVQLTEEREEFESDETSNEDERLRAELMPSLGLGRLEKEGKAKLVNGKWERA